MSRTAQIPSWSRNIAEQGGDVESTHQAFWEFDQADKTGEWSTGRGSDTPAPCTDKGWLEFLEWALDDAESEALSRVRVALEARTTALNPDTPWVSVEAIANQVKMAQGSVHIAGHMVTND